VTNRAMVDDDDPLDHEIDFSSPRANPYARRFGRNRNLRILSPDVIKVFPDSELVNEALHSLLRANAAPPSALGRRHGSKDRSMKKKEITATEDDMLPEYDFRGGVRGKYARDFGRNQNLRILAPDLLEVFPDSESVNEALRTLVRVATASAAVPVKRSARTASAPKSKKKARA
jgi:hypothetical protein